MKRPDMRTPAERTSPIAPVVVLVAIATLMAGCASTPSSRTAAKADDGAAAGAANTDLLLAEALRQYVDHRDPAQALAMAQLAVKRSPQRTDATWLLLQICSGASACQPEPLETRLRNLDPVNGAVWLGVLNRAGKRGDTAAADQILEAIGRSERLDLYWNDLVATLAMALAERTRTTTPSVKTPLSDALNEIVRLLSSVAVPAFAPLGESCSARRLVDKLVSARCLLVAATLQRSDTYIGESMGLGIAQRLAATDSTETGKVERRIAMSRYQRDTAGEIISAQVERERFATELLELMRKQRREQDVFIAIIRWAGRPLTPAPTG